MAELDIIIEQLKQLNLNMGTMQTELSEFKTEIRSSLVDIKGKSKGNYELLKKSLEHIEKQNELQHSAIEQQIAMTNNALEGHKKQIDHLYDLDRERAAREEKAQESMLTKIDRRIEKMTESHEKVMGRILACM